MSNATGANTTPLGRLNPAMNITKIQQASLLKPSYISGPGSTMPSMNSGSMMANLPHANMVSSPSSMSNFVNPAVSNNNSYNSTPMKRERDDEDEQLFQPLSDWGQSSNLNECSNTSWTSQEQTAGERKRKRRSRWGADEKEKVFIPGMPTVLPNNLSPEQEKAYLLQLQIEEMSRRLRTGDLGIPPNPEERSPSPEPIYNSEGKRLNTREYRTRKKLEDDRHALIQEMFKVNPEYKPPADYKPPMIRVCEKVMIPQEEHPDINFVGLLIGPRGNTLKSMEKETGAKIIIRGKGSVKEGKVGRKDGQPLPGEDEPLHAFVTATNPEAVKKAVDKIREIIRQGVEVPEGQNDLRRMQLRELALLNGTLRENEGPRCTNCGATNHRSWQCPDKPNVTNNVICTNCGGAGHIARDCREKKGAVVGTTGFGGGGADKSKIDEEYMSLMAELGEGPPVVTKSTGSSYNSGPSPLSGPQGMPRAIMAPPPNSSPNGSQGSMLAGQNWMSMGGKPAGMQQMQGGVPPMQPPNMMGVNNGVPPPPGTGGPSGNIMMSPWPQGGMGMSQGQNGMGMGPPPGMFPQGPQGPNGNQAMGMQQGAMQGMPWMMQPPGMGEMQMHPNPWQQQPNQQQGMHMGQVPGGTYPWMGYLGVPPPPPGQMQLLGVPPPPPPTTMGGNSSAIDMNVLPNLLAAPPPPPPPPS